jgi:hypothetical protein
VAPADPIIEAIDTIAPSNNGPLGDALLKACGFLKTTLTKNH